MEMGRGRGEERERERERVLLERTIHKHIHTYLGTTMEVAVISSIKLIQSIIDIASSM